MKNVSVFFKPQRIAVVGASLDPKKIGYQILKNIIDGGFEGEIIPVNPRAQEVLGRKAFKSLTEVPAGIDMVIVAIPANQVLAVLNECVRAQVKGVAVISSGFAEAGRMDEEKELKKVADDNDIALLGPNIFGLAYPPQKLNASFGPKDVYPGRIAFITQSGALGIGLMGWTAMKKIGLAALVSLGNKADVDEQDMIHFFNQDKNVDVILIYMEGIKDGAKFLKTKIEKPTVILKVGRSQRGAKAAASHTGSLSGSDKIYDAVFNQLGIMRADTFTEAFSWARALSLPIPQGDGVVIITNGGGIGVIATDECEAQGLKILDDPQWFETKFRPVMPDYGSTKNPIDVTGGAGVNGYQEALRIALSQERVGSVIVLYCETAVTDPLDVAKMIDELYRSTNRCKPVLVSMVGGERTRDALTYLNERNIPASSLVDGTVSALKSLYRWKGIQQRQATPMIQQELPSNVRKILDEVQKEGRSVLMEHEARLVMELCGIPTPRWAFVRTADEAVLMADQKAIYPLAMKIASVDIIHKTDVGGVVLNIRDAQELREQFNLMMQKVQQKQPTAKLLGVNLVQMVSGVECIVGSTTDPQFGTAVMFGLGGVFVEALKDVSFRVVPFSEQDAKELMGEIKAKKILEGFRGMVANQASIIQILMAIQKLAPYVQEIDINPLLSNHSGSYAVDARIVLKTEPSSHLQQQESYSVLNHDKILT